MIDKYISPVERYKDIKDRADSFKKPLIQELNNLYTTAEPRKELEFQNTIFYTDVISMKFKYLQGRIYNFDYFYSNDPKERPFVDLRPMVFVLKEYIDKKGVVKIKGIDLNYLPEIGVVSLVNLFFLMFRPHIERDLGILKKKIIPIPNILIKDIDRYFKEATKHYNLNYAVRTYTKKQIVYNTTKVVRLEDFVDLFLYTGYEKTLKGLSPQEIKSNWYRT